MKIGVKGPTYEDIQQDKVASSNEIASLYDTAINDNDDVIAERQEQVKAWGETQSALQQQQYDFQVEQINQQKDQASKDYVKEQKGAYSDYQKQINPYGVNAERMAEQGMMGTGYSESSKVSMYNQYQNRVATAREVFNRSILNYDNMIKEARLQNDSRQVEIANAVLERSFELMFQGLQYRTDLSINKANALTSNNQYYDGLGLNLYSMNLGHEEFNQSQAENKRQFNKSFNEGKRQFWATFNANNSGGKGNNPGGKGNNSGGIGNIGNKNDDTVNIGYKKVLSTAKNKKNPKAYINRMVQNGTITNAQGKQIKKKLGLITKEPTVDMNSVIALGYGAISASYLNTLIKQGKVIEYESDGKLKYKKASTVSNTKKTTETKNKKQKTASDVRKETEKYTWSNWRSFK